MRTIQSRFPIFIAIALLAGACNPVTAFEPKVVVHANSFQIDETLVKSATERVIYEWANAGTRAGVTHATTTTSAGFAAIVIRDAVGELVYSSALRPDLIQETTIGVPGVWTIEVKMTGFSGTLAFRVDRLDGEP